MPRSRARVPVAEVVDVEENEAEGAFHALDAVGFAKEHGEHGFAVVDAGEVVGLGVEGGGFAEEFELAEAAMAAQDGFEAKAQEGRFDGARGEVVDDALGETIDPLLVTVSEVRTMGKRLPVASARAAARRRLISMPGRLTSMRATVGGWLRSAQGGRLRRRGRLPRGLHWRPVRVRRQPAKLARPRRAGRYGGSG